MNLLAIDTATETISVALGINGKDTWFFEVDAGLRHSELIMDSIDMLLQKAAIKPEALSGVLCMGGPGSFTGLRIGFSLAKGLALSLGLPYAAIPTLDCLAWPFSAWPGIIMPVLDAKKQAFFCALYHNGKRLCPDMDAAPAEIARAIADTGMPAPVLLVGPGAPILHEHLTDTVPGIQWGKGLRWGNAGTLLRIAQETRIIANNTAHYANGPEYIRKSDAELQSQA
ncbi:MAG: tRNA (adenosine(37)-N6)-threonylcarbamoyltransferase complex dimerization subunit type 1 TsaB [Treponema sp.]|nr:tRNA (adenosine(37)-N6)-threonylcarbamoyltransferase complex dimerization subunit type 1 TsaB [Treponema sp.]